MLSAVHHVREQYEEAAMSNRVQLIMRRRNQVSEVAEETLETFYILLKAVELGRAAQRVERIFVCFVTNE